MAANHISITSHSPAVSQSLQAILTRAGWSVVDVADASIHLMSSPNRLDLRYGDSIRELGCPISPNALLAAIANSAASVSLAPAILDGQWIFDRNLRSLCHADAHVTAASHMLTEKESLLMAALLDASPAAVSREHLLRNVWSYEADVETHTLETHIYRLRQKLEAMHPRPCDIETIEGAYRLVLQASV